MSFSLYAALLAKIYRVFTKEWSDLKKINNKFISHLTRAKRTPSAAVTVQVFYALIIILQCVHPGSHDTHPHDNRLRSIYYVYVVVSICGTSDPALLENTIE
jgi:hypothetical protein